MRWTLVTFVVACSSPAALPPPIQGRAPAPVVAPPPPSMVDQVVRAELEHWQADPAWLPDAKLLDPGPVRVLRDIDIAHMANNAVTDELQHIAPSALPAGPRAYALLTKDALQAEADRVGHEITYVAFDVTFFAGAPEARVGFEVSLVLPSAKKGMVLCCCGATDLFADHDGRWTLTKRHAVVCS
jgi:hypothetical protein